MTLIGTGQPEILIPVNNNNGDLNYANIIDANIDDKNYL
jgi:hypothetical protein